MAIRPFAVRVAAVVRSAQAPHEAVLRDYALSYMLAAIYAAQPVGEVFAFKGGTALRKCFFAGYRFSEDLDFTLMESWSDDAVEESLKDAADRAVKLTAPYGDFRFAVERREHREDHPFGQIDFRLRVDYPTGASLPIKVEITRDEPIVLDPIRLNLIHLFENETLESTVLCYSLDEIAIEKLRAFLQARKNLERRDWLSRARDLYDLSYLWRQKEITVNWDRLRTPLEEKARARDVTFTGPDDFRDPRVLAAYRQQWEARLQGFVRELPTFDEALADLDAILKAIFG